MNKPFLRKLNKMQSMDDLGSDFAMFDGSYLHINDLGDEINLEGDGINLMEDNQSRINVWLISDEEMGAMIPKILKPEDLEFTFAMIMVDLDNPWDVMNQCEKWMKVLKDAIF